MGKLTDAIKMLIAANVVLFGITYFIPGNEDRMIEMLSLYFPLNDHFHWWQLVTSVFMHGGFFHLFLNMYALWAFGSVLEQLWGSKRFLVFYFLCGLGAGIIYLSVNYYQYTTLYQELTAAGIDPQEIDRLLRSGSSGLTGYSEKLQLAYEKLYGLFNIPALGASGAIYGVLVAFGMMFPDAKLALIFFPVPIPAKYFIPGLIAIDLFSGVTGFSIFSGGVAHFGHVGGALIGFLLMWYWRKPVDSWQRHSH
jgi:membrane associated rhomboid family serine protease